MSRINPTTLPQNAEQRRIYCAYHQNEMLTNFCCDSECLMPLCPNCIVEHTEQHFLENNKPAYVNLQEVLLDTKQKCYQHIVLFEELSRANDKIYDYLMGLRESIHNQLLEDKEEIIKEIGRLFEIYEENLFADAAAKYKELEVYDRKETMSISEFINEQIETLHEQISTLKGENCLAGLITYYSNDGKIYEESIRELNDYVAKHKKAGKLSVNTDFQKLGKTLEGFCETNVSVEYISEDLAREKEEEARMKESRASKEGKSILGRLNKRNHSESLSKENNLNQSNHDYQNTFKKNEDLRIDVNEPKYSRIHHSKANFQSGYSRAAIGVRQHY